MAQARLSMRKLREIARLRFEAGRTLQEIASAAGVARSTVQVTLQRLTAAGLSWPWPDDVDEQALDAQLFPSPPIVSAEHLPDFAKVRTELGCSATINLRTRDNQDEKQSRRVMRA